MAGAKKDAIRRFKRGQLLTYTPFKDRIRVAVNVGPFKCSYVTFDVVYVGLCKDNASFIRVRRPDDPLDQLTTVVNRKDVFNVSVDSVKVKKEKKMTSRTLSETTTDLDVIRRDPNRYVWGNVTAIHDIGSYTFVETDEGAFHVYVDGKNTCHSASTLDRALIIAVARKNLEANKARWMGDACMRLLGIEHKDGE